jgi:hypothetical protein
MVGLSRFAFYEALDGRIAGSQDALIFRGRNSSGPQQW